MMQDQSAKPCVGRLNNYFDFGRRQLPSRTTIPANTTPSPTQTAYGVIALREDSQCGFVNRRARTIKSLKLARIERTIIVKPVSCRISANRAVDRFDCRAISRDDGLGSTTDASFRSPALSMAAIWGRVAKAFDNAMPTLKTSY